MENLYCIFIHCSGVEWVRGGVGAERTMVFLFKFVRSTRARAHEMRRSWRMLMRRFDVMTEYIFRCFTDARRWTKSLTRCMEISINVRSGNVDKTITIDGFTK